MQCIACAKRRIDRDGGEQGLCWQHRKRKCAICQTRSHGEEFCSDCTKKVQFERQRAIINFTAHGDADAYRNALAVEALRDARLQAYSFVDALFRILTVNAQQINSKQSSAVEPDRQTEFHFVA